MRQKILGLAFALSGALFFHGSVSAQRTIAVPLLVHDGGGRETLAGDAYVDVLVESANRWFEPAGVCFYVEGRRALAGGGDAERIERSMPESPAVRVAFVRELTRRGRSIRGFGGRRGDSRYVVVDRLDGGRLTLAHELGHAFGLGHARNGVMSRSTHWWGRAAGMSRSQQRQVREQAQRFEREHGRHEESRCIRTSIPSRHSIGMNSDLLIAAERNLDAGAFAGRLLFGRKHGVGRMTYRNGDSYDGEWRLGERTGRGRYRWRSGGEYWGDFRRALRSGQGTMRYASGKRYTGAWRNNKRHGHGLLHLADGDRYEGAFRHDRRHGRGHYRFASGAWVEGRWSRNQRVETYRRGRRPTSWDGVDELTPR